MAKYFKPLLGRYQYLACPIMNSKKQSCLQSNHWLKWVSEKSLTSCWTASGVLHWHWQQSSKQAREQAPKHETQHKPTERARKCKNCSYADNVGHSTEYSTEQFWQSSVLSSKPSPLNRDRQPQCRCEQLNETKQRKEQRCGANRRSCLSTSCTNDAIFQLTKGFPGIGTAQ